MIVTMNKLSPFSSSPGGSLPLPLGVSFCSTGGKYWGAHCFVDESYSGSSSGPLSSFSNSALGTKGMMLSGNQQSAMMSPL